MKTTFDILDRLFPALNTTAVKSTLGGGKVYRGKRPLNSTARDVVIVPLPVSGGTDIQSGVFFVNCRAPNLQNGAPDESTLRATVAAVETAIQGYSASSEFFELEIAAQNIYPDETDDRWSVASVRVNYLIQTP